MQTSIRLISAMGFSLASLLPFLIAPLFFAQTMFAQQSPEALEKYIKGLSTKQTLILQEKAEGGELEASLKVGLRYFLEWQQMGKQSVYGRYIRPEMVREKREDSRKWLFPAAEKGNAAAQYYYAMTFRSYAGVTSNYSEFKLWLSKAAESKYRPAMVEMGRLYRDPCCGEKKDTILAEKWYSQAAALGDATALYVLAKMSEATNDQEKANKYYLSASRKGHSLAQNDLGIRLAEGVGSKPDAKKAIHWFQQSIENGNSYAACNLALHHVRGEGVKKDLISALKWAYISHSLDSLKCHPSDFAEYLKPTESQQKKAWELAIKWLKKHSQFTNDFGERPWLDEKSGQ
jgi:uncharacterized protein